MLILLFLAPLVAPLLLQRRAPQALQVELGTAFTQPVPSAFHNFQYTQLLNFTHQTEHTPSNLCYMKTSQ
jgi:hypothetical protein